MTIESRKVQLTTEVDASGAKQGFEQVKQGARDMAQSVAQAGQQAGKGMDAIGDGAKRAGDGMTREESRIRSAIQRATLDLQTLGQSASQKLAAKIDFQGLDATKFAPFLAALREAEQEQARLQAGAKGSAFIGDLQGQIAALREQAQLQGQSTEAVLRYKAAQLGVSEQSSHLITQLTNMRAAQEAAAQAAREEAAAQKEAALQATRRSSFIDSLKQQSDAIGKTRADLLEMQAAELGVTKSAAPYIAKLREAEAGQGSLGNSAKMTAFALRQVPMQFTDIVVSLSAGQRPMQVLLQQGGQLKDLFGGIGPAARALGGYIVGLINPLTVAAAAAVALGVAMASAESKARSLAAVQAQLGGTGRTDLFSDSGLRDFIKELSLAPGVTRDAATAIVSELSKVHEIGGGIFKDLGRLAADYAKATGTDIPTAARTLAQAFADPAKGAKTLDDALGKLTSGQILYIEKLARSGDLIGAQRALLQALEQATRGLNERGATPLQKSFSDLGNAWEKASDKFSNSDGLRTLNSVLAKTIEGVAWLIEHAPQMPTLGVNMIPAMGGVALAMRAAEELRASPPTEPQRTSAGKVGESETASIEAASKASEDQIKKGLELASAHRSEAGQIKDLTEQRAGLNKALAESNRLYGANSEQSQRLRDGIAGINKQISELGKGQQIIDAQLQEKIQAAQNALTRERETLAFQDRFLQGEYQAGRVSLVDFYDKKLKAITAGTDAEIAALEAERKAVEDALAKTRDPGKRAEQRKQLSKIDLQEQDARTRGDRETQLTNQEKAASFLQLDEQLKTYRANLLQLAGDEAAAARLRNEIIDQQDKRFQDQTKDRPGALSDRDLESAKKLRDQQVALNEVKQQTSFINERLQIEEERIALAQQTGAIGEIDALKQEGAARAQAVAKMQEQLAILERLSQERPQDLQLKIDVEGFRLQVDKLKASLDPLKEKFDGIFKDAGSNFLTDLMNGSKAKEALRHWADNIAKPINDMVGRQLGEQVFGKQGALGGAGGIFADLFGGKDRQKPTAGAIDTTDIDLSLSNLRTVGVEPATDALARLQAAADGAASSLGQGPATTGDFTRLDRGQTGEQSVMDMFRDASRTTDAVTAANERAAGAVLNLASASARGGSALSSLPAVIQQIIAAASASSGGGGGGFAGLIGAFLGGGSGSSGFGSGAAYGNQDLGLFFADGGYTGRGDPRKVAGIVHGEEYVFSAAAVRAIGLRRLERMHQLAKNGRMSDQVPGYADGGYVAPMAWQGGGQYLMPPQQEVRAGNTYVTTHRYEINAPAGMSRATANQLGAAAVQGGMQAARRNGKKA